MASSDGADIATGPPRALMMKEAWRRRMEVEEEERARRRRMQPSMLQAALGAGGREGVGGWSWRGGLERKEKGVWLEGCV